MEEPLLPRGVASVQVLKETMFDCDVCNAPLQRQEDYQKFPWAKFPDVNNIHCVCISLIWAWDQRVHKKRYNPLWIVSQN